MKIRALIGVWLVALMGLAMCGAGLPDIGLSSNRGKMAVGLKTSLANGGGGAAGWDTVTVIFSPETLVDAAIDTFGYPTSGQIAADLTRVHYLNDVLLGRNGQGSPATFVKLGAGGVTSFAYANISNYGNAAADTTGYINPSGDRIRIQAQTSAVYDGVRMLDLNFPNTLRKSELVYIPFEDYIPANSTIVSATVNVSIVSAPALITFSDSVIVQPIPAAWDKWMLVKDVGAADYVAHAAWNFQQSTGPAGAWGGSNAYPWVPDLDYIPKLWDIDPVSDWTTNLTANIPEKSNWAIYATNTVQAFVNGQPNTGFIMNLADYASFTMYFDHFRWDASTTATRRMPAVIVKYITKRYTPLYGTSDWAFVLATDDAKLAINDTLATIMANRGMPYTINAADVYLDGAGEGTTADLIRWHDMGHEIGSHTVAHINLNRTANPIWTGLNYLTLANAPYAASDTIGASWDSLKVEMSPEWLYARADAAGRDLRPSSRFAKSLALPNNTWNPWVVKRAGAIGYRALRVQGEVSVNTSGVIGLHAASQLGAASTDTARVAFGVRAQRAPRDMMLLPPSMGVQYIVGQKANTTITEAQVKNNMARAIFQTRGDGRNALHLFFHDFKSGGYNEGVDPEEMRWMADQVTLYGGRAMTQSGFTTWNMAGSVAIDTPPDMSQDDLFRFQASDRVWYKPNGIDNRWIRGVR